MAFTPQFLDELRARVSLPDLIGRRVRLVKRGREYTGLCPFHNEKTPSFTVNEVKGFYHCFGCGAHGSAIDFVMQTEGLAFPEAVEKLAGEAGLEVPKATPEEREREKKRATLYDVMEAACAWFESRLRSAAGRGALDYLHGRGIGDGDIARFRLGWAPESRNALKLALMGETLTEAKLIEAGLLIQPDDGSSYDRFRGRVIFPITDRRGRPVAFGGRILGDGEPKYLNSPDTPLFNKGQLLYGMAQAREAAHKAGRVIVTEGYTDVIALNRAGLAEAVAPLGTALTESQIELLWRMAPEPVLCFDGDAAGQRAAGRAAERALPLLKPGLSLRFVALPAGEDPDSLIKRGGAAAMRAVLSRDRPLDAVIWDIETAGQKLDTPERRAGLEKRLNDRVRLIGDETVQYQYRAAFRQRLRDLTWGDRRPQGRFAGRHGAGTARPPSISGPGAATGTPDPAGSSRLRGALLLAAFLNHPALLDRFAETLGRLTLADPALDKLRQEILKVYGSVSDLDSGTLRGHLEQAGFASSIDALLSPRVLGHGGFTRGASPALAEAGVRAILVRELHAELADHLAEAERAFRDDQSDDNWSRWQELIEANERAEAEFAALDEDGVSVGATGTVS